EAQIIHRYGAARHTAAGARQHRYHGRVGIVRGDPRDRDAERLPGALDTRRDAQHPSTDAFGGLREGVPLCERGGDGTAIARWDVVLILAVERPWARCVMEVGGG